MSQFTEFLRERRYLHNVSPATISWYTHALKWLPSESPTQDELKDTVLRMREKGLKETGCNAVIRAVNSYLHWNSGAERKCGSGCSHPRIAQLKEPQNVIAHSHRGPSQAACELEAQAKQFLSAAVASTRSLAAGYWLPDYGGPDVASLRRGHG